MKRKTSLIAAAVLAAAALSACGGGSHDVASSLVVVFIIVSSSSSSGGGSTVQQLDTAQVLALAQQTSEVSSPFQVNDGALTLTDTSDTSQAIVIDAM